VNTCKNEPVEIFNQNGTVGKQWESVVKADIALYTIEKLGHGWPNGQRDGLLAADVIWDFFAAHPKQFPLVEGASASACDKCIERMKILGVYTFGEYGEL
jgi:hypothetical protein